jgi:hypothetical protein
MLPRAVMAASAQPNLRPIAASMQRCGAATRRERGAARRPSERPRLAVARAPCSASCKRARVAAALDGSGARRGTSPPSRYRASAAAGTPAPPPPPPPAQQARGGAQAGAPGHRQRVPQARRALGQPVGRRRRRDALQVRRGAGAAAGAPARSSATGHGRWRRAACIERSAHGSSVSGRGAHAPPAADPAARAAATPTGRQGARRVARV